MPSSQNLNLYPMFSIFRDAFNDVPASPGKTPAGRHAAFEGYVEREGAKDFVDGLCVAAARSMCLAAFSSYAKAEQLDLEQPKAVARRSLGLLDTSWLSHEEEKRYHEMPFAYRHPGRIDMILPQHLVAVETPDGSAIDFGPLHRARLDGRGPDAASGCPAPRLRINALYEQYVDLVLTPDN